MPVAMVTGIVVCPPEFWSTRDWRVFESVNCNAISIIHRISVIRGLFHIT
jgi:hypothetical protein